jgi:chromosome segregation ATPase
MYKIAKIEKNYDTAKADNKNLNERMEEMIRKFEAQSSVLIKTQIKLEEARNRITAMEKELRFKDESISEKETKLYQYELKINDLEKSKHVLSFRTTEIRKELEPKESQIDNLKRELFKL